MQILKGVGETLEFAGGKKSAQPELDPRGFPKGFSHRPVLSQRGCDDITRLVFLDKLLNLRIGDFSDAFDEIAHAVTVHRKTKLHLCRDLVAFGHSDFAHVVSKAGKLGVLPVVPRGGSAGPRADLRLYFRVLPISDNDLPVQAHPAHDVTVFTVTVRSLIQIHEIHVYG